MALVFVGGILFSAALRDGTASAPPAVRSFAVLIGAPLLTALFSRQLWRWANHRLCKSRGAGAVRVAPGRPANPTTGTAESSAGASQRLQQPPHESVPRPIIAPAGEPDAPFLARCEAAAATLAEMLTSAAGEQQRTAMSERLEEHYRLRYAQAAGHQRAAHRWARAVRWATSGQSARGGSSAHPEPLSTVEAAAALGSGAASGATLPPGFDGAARALHGLAMRYPASPAPLAQGAFRWTVPPKRGPSRIVTLRRES